MRDKILPKKQYHAAGCPEPWKVSLIERHMGRMGKKLKKQEGFSRVQYGELAITKFKNLMKQYGIRNNKTPNLKKL